PPPDRLPPLARRPPARARAGAVARSLQLPPRVESGAEPPGLAVRARLLAVVRPLRARARLERARPARVRRGRRVHVPLAPRARPAARGSARRRTRLRDRPVPGGAERRSPARADLDPAPARALRDREGVARARRRGRRLHSALRPG